MIGSPTIMHAANPDATRKRESMTKTSRPLRFRLHRWPLVVPGGSLLVCMGGPEDGYFIERLREEL